MALPNLATLADLSARGADVSDPTLVDVMLAVASAVVRGAAQSPILSASSTVTLWAFDGGEQFLDLPGKPVTAVSSVTVDGSAVTDYKLVHGRLWRPGGWSDGCEPVEVVVSLTHGFASVPEDIKQLVCDLAILGVRTAPEGARDASVVAESVDDYSVTFADGASAVASAMTLPALTRVGLRKRFGGGAALVVSR